MALQGQIARVRVHETMTKVLSNASERVTFGDGRFTNQLDVVKALASGIGKRNRPFNLKKCSRTDETLRIWVEESTNALPCVKLDAQLGVALGTKDALAKHVRNDHLADRNFLDDLFLLVIDPETGCVGPEDGQKLGKTLPHPQSAMFLGAVSARIELLEILFGKDEEEFMAVDQMLYSVVLPTARDDLSYVIVGDGEPLYVVAENVRVNGKLMQHFEGWVRQGEELHLAPEKKDSKLDVRFFLDAPEKKD